MMYFELEIRKPIYEYKLDRPIKHQHVTLCYNPTDEEYSKLIGMIRQEFDFMAVGYGCTKDNEGYAVELPRTIPYFNTAIPHITVSLSKTGKAVDTGYIGFHAIKPFKLHGTIRLIAN